MDNREVFIKGRTFDSFKLAMQLAFNGYEATHFADHPQHGLVFAWREVSLYVPQTKDLKSSPLPASMDWESAARLAWKWLEEQKESRFLDKEYCGDVWNKRAWRIEGGLGKLDFSVICAIHPVWAHLHK